MLNRTLDISYIDIHKIDPYKDTKNHWAFYDIMEASIEPVPVYINHTEAGWKSHKEFRWIYAFYTPVNN